MTTNILPTPQLRQDERPAVSVIVPCFNDGKTLTACIHSIMAQTDSPTYEVLIVDDCSTDPGTRRTIDALAQQFGIRTLRTLSGGSCGAARNLGAHHSHGQWLAFLDADDTWRPHALSTMWRAASANPGAEFIGADHALVVDGERTQEHGVFERGDLYANWARPAYALGHPVRHERPVRTYLQGVMAWTGAVLVSASLFQRLGGFDPSLRQAQDIHLWIRLAAETDYVFCPSVVSNRHIRQASLSHSTPSLNADWRVACYRRLLTTDSLRDYRVELRTTLRRVLLRSSARHLTAGNRLTAAARALEALTISPLDLQAWRRLLSCGLSLPRQE